MCGAAFLCLSGDFFEGGGIIGRITWVNYRANTRAQIGRITWYITGTLYVIVESFDAAVLPILSPKNALISLLAV